MPRAAESAALRARHSRMAALAASFALGPPPSALNITYKASFLRTFRPRCLPNGRERMSICLESVSMVSMGESIINDVSLTVERGTYERPARSDAGGQDHADAADGRPR